MNAAQALLREVIRDSKAWEVLDPDLLQAIAEEVDGADTTPTHTEPIHRTDCATGEQTMRRLGLVRDEPSSSAAAWAPGGTDEDRTVY